MNSDKGKRRYRRDTRKRIIQSALELFSSQDFHNVTLRKIAQRAGIAPSQVYKYFKNKDDLFIALCNLYNKPITEDARDYASKGKDTLSRLRRLTWHHFTFADNNIDVVTFAYVSTTYRYWWQAKESFKEARESIKLFINILLDGQIKGDVRADVNLRLVSQFYFGTIRYMIVDWLHDGCRYKLSSLADEVADNIYLMIKK